MPPLEVHVLADGGDDRGRSYAVPDVWSRFLAAGVDLHLTSIRPGRTRGNHWHRTRKEVILVFHAGDWSLFWEDASEGAVRRRRFTGTGAVLILVEPGIPHALLNEAETDLLTVGITDGRYDASDTVARRLTPA